MPTMLAAHGLDSTQHNIQNSEKVKRYKAETINLFNKLFYGALWSLVKQGMHITGFPGHAEQ